jgi:serine phosphatase RsbU (regulator of sigma subunit)/anti-sigma regulatory factor (Ser/Thr protein kinase)
MRWVVTSATVALLSAGVIATGALSERHMRQTLTREIEARLVLEARNLALTGTGALLSGLPELTLAPIVREMERTRPEIALVVVTDHQGLVQGHIDPRLLGRRWTPPADLVPLAGATPLAPGERLLGSAELLVAETPVLHLGRQRLGAVMVGMRRAYVEEAVASARRQQMFALALLLPAGIAAALVMMTLLLRPLGTLREGLERIGAGDLDSPIRLRDRTELGALAETVNDMARRLKRAQREAIEKERLARELELAREIQQRLLSKGRREAGEFTTHAAHRAAQEVGGDYVEVLARRDSRLLFAIADVAGKGLAGCLVMSMLASLLRAMRDAYDSPRALLVALEARLLDTLRPGEFVTMCCGILDPESGRLSWASAGHTPMACWRGAQGTLEWRSSSGIPLGALRGRLEASLEDQALELEPGDTLVLFTDGIPEAFEPGGTEAFGAERIERTIREHASIGPEALAEALFSAVDAWTEEHPRQDDETVLVIARAPLGARDHGAEGTRWLAEARRRGVTLTLSADLDALAALREWLARCPGLGGLDPDQRERLELGIHEACANVVEHGLRSADQDHFQLWWLPEESVSAPRSTAGVCPGRFVVLDQGTPFAPGDWHPTDYGAPEARRRERGHGLDIIHRIFGEVRYEPGTSAGNVTVLRFDPQLSESSEEVGHA